MSETKYEPILYLYVISAAFQIILMQFMPDGSFNASGNPKAANIRVLYREKHLYSYGKDAIFMINQMKYDLYVF